MAIAKLIESDDLVDPVVVIVNSKYGLISHHMVVALYLREPWLEYLKCVDMVQTRGHRSSHRKSGVEGVTLHCSKQAHGAVYLNLLLLSRDIVAARPLWSQYLWAPKSAGIVRVLRSEDRPRGKAAACRVSAEQALRLTVMEDRLLYLQEVILVLLPLAYVHIDFLVVWMLG